MVFNIGFHSIQKLNIKNIHGFGDQSANEVMMRKFEILPKINRKERYSLIQSCLENLKSSVDTIETKGTVFGTVPSDKALETANRLCVPRNVDKSAILKARKRVLKNKVEKHATELNTEQIDAKDNENKEKEKYEEVDEDVFTYEEQRKHVERVNAPTVTSKIRLKLLQMGNKDVDIGICDRSVLQASQRYFPGAYETWHSIDNFRGGKTRFRKYLKDHDIDPSMCPKVVVQDYTRQHRNNCKCEKYNKLKRAIL